MARAATEAPAPAAERQFSLQFASDAALAAQLRTDAVRLYVVAGKRAWRVRLTGKVPSLEPAPRPGSYHEMTSDTVPARFVRAASVDPRGPGAGTDSRLTWAVVLPGRIQTGIQALMRDAPGGVLVIHGDGSVRHESAKRKV